MKLKIYSTFCWVLFMVLTVNAESYKVKKLTDELGNASKPEEKISLLIEIANEIKGSFPDSAIYYFQQAESLIQGVKKESDKEVLRVRLLLGRTSVEVAKGNYDQAMTLDSLALIKSRQLKNSELEAQALMSKGGILYHLSEFELAQEINHEALKLVRTTNDYKTEGKILTNMGTIEFMFGNAATADSLFRIPLQLAEQAHDEDLLAASLLNVGLLNIYLGEYDVARQHITRATEIYKTIDGKDGLVLCYQNLATIWFEQGDIEKAIEFNTLNYNLSVELGDKLGLSKACQNLGECYSQIGNYEKALAFFIQSLEIKTALGDLKGIASSQSSIGHIHYLQDEFSLALEYYRKTLNIYSEIGYEMGLAGSYGSIGSILNEQNKQDSALYYFAKSAGFYEKNGNVNYLANLFLNIGKVYLVKEDFEHAENYIRKAELLKTQTDDKLGLFNVWILFANLHYKKALTLTEATVQGKSELKTAMDFAKKAYNMAGSNGNIPGQRESAGLLTDIFSKLGNLDEALKYASIKMERSDSLSKVQRAEALANAEISWKAEKKQEEINRLENEKALQTEVIVQKSALANRLILIIAFILLALILIIAAGILFFKNKAKQKALDHQKHIAEITRLKMQNINNRLSPHLFFNLLNSVSDDAGDVRKVKEKLGQTALLLRTSLENTEQTAISLSRELEMVKAYISLQSSRLHDTFKADFLISESVDLKIQIPAMMLQIPVENAIKHGLMPLEGEKKLTVSIQKSNQAVVLKVEDNGIGRKNSQGRTSGTGTGLKVLLQTIRLLNQQNKEQIIFMINDKEPQGTGVEIIIPEKFDYSL